MLFNSPEFAVFFVIVTTLYFVLPHPFRWSLLLAASCIFYMVFKPVYILILFFTITVDYAAGILIENAAGPRRKTMLVASLIANIGVLAFFKYANFITSNVVSLASALHIDVSLTPWNIILPIGLSFHTFQSMSYTIEVYRGRQAAERHFGLFALYVMFYPQLVAGPIERPQNLLHQFREIHSFDGQRFCDGLKLMTWGLFKKVVIADRLAVVVDNVYNAPREFTGIALVIATVFFAFQIYCDFSGYSEIAIGAAKVMGFRLMDNFHSPYFSTSVSEFWRRWHISLSTWFKDYLYVPLGGNRVGPVRWSFNIMLTFLISGLWHGANWTYIIWGGLHGVFLLIEKAFSNVSQSLPHALKRAYVFALVCVAWVFFRANHVSDACYIVGHMFSGLPASLSADGIRALVNGQVGFYLRSWLVSFALIGFLLGMEYLQKDRGFDRWIAPYPAWVRWSVYYGIVIGFFCLGTMRANKFIYFQF